LLETYAFGEQRRDGVGRAAIHSTAFGIDSVIELVTGAVLLWRLSAEAHGSGNERAERAERTAPESRSRFSVSMFGGKRFGDQWNADFSRRWMGKWLLHFLSPYGEPGNAQFEMTALHFAYGDGIVDLKLNGTLRSASDERLKTDIKTVGDALAAVQKLRGVSFRWKSSGKADLGLIAQEVEKVFPQLVTTDSRGFKALAHPSLIGVLVESIKQSKAENDAAITRLTNENAALQDRVRRLEAAVERLAATSPSVAPPKMAATFSAGGQRTRN
jgi:hypothetical protein